jgi:hypothetical protein
MRIFRDFDAIKSAFGKKVVVSDWSDATQERIGRFAQTIGNDQWTHLDVDRTERESPSGTTIAHGLLTLSLAPIFVQAVVDLEGVTNTLNHGANRIWFLSPGSGRHMAARSYDCCVRGEHVPQRPAGPLRRQNGDREPSARGLPGRVQCHARPISQAARALRRLKCNKGLNTSLWRLS